MLNRRELLQFSLMGLGLSGLPKAFSAEISAQLQSSDLIYLTPIQTSGKESSCQAEIWYVWDGVDIYVCTKSKSWRTKASRLGLARTRIWIGDLGVWTKADYKKLPSISAVSSIIANPMAHHKALEMFGEKYPLPWLRWGSVFKKELASGERSLIRYRPLSI